MRDCDKGPRPCKKCKHSYVPLIDRLLFMGGSFRRCRHPKVYTQLWPFTKEKLGFCSVERDSYITLNVCGPEGLYFEPRNSK